MMTANTRKIALSLAVVAGVSLLGACADKPGPVSCSDKPGPIACSNDTHTHGVYFHGVAHGVARGAGARDLRVF